MFSSVFTVHHKFSSPATLCLLSWGFFSDVEIDYTRPMGLTVEKAIWRSLLSSSIFVKKKVKFNNSKT